MAMLPPGPRIPSAIQLFWWLSRPISFFDHCTQRYGNCFTASFPGLPPSIFISDPDMIREIFQGDPMELYSGKSNATWMEPLVGSHSILVLDGEKHRRARKLMSPPFKSDRMQVYANEMREVVDDAMDRWSLGTPFPVHAEMQRITLHIIVRSVFGIDKAAQFDRLTKLLSQLLGQSTKSTLYSALAVLLRKQLKEPETRKKIEAFMPKDSFFGIKREVDELIYSEIAQRRRSTEKRTDMLSLLMEARDENGEAMTDEELHNEMLSLLVAGHETTANTLAWAFHHVLSHPEAQEKIKAELAQVVGEAPLAKEHLNRLEYLDACIRETQRITPVVPAVVRELQQPMKIGTWEFPAGTRVTPCIYMTHHRGDLWPESQRFRPERFFEKNQSVYEYFPFGGGARRCLGMGFATYEMRIVLAQVFSRLSLRAAPDVTVRLENRGMLYAPSNGMPIIVDSRTARR
jgi:cytochrome P450